MSMLFLSESDMKKAIDMGEAIDALEEAFRMHSRKETITPLRTHLELEEVGGMGLFMPSWVAPIKALGIKAITVYPENPQKGLPFIQGTVLLYNGDTGAQEAILEASYITRLRTGASCGVATRRLAPQGSERAAIIGTGAQSFMQMWAVITAAPTVREYYIFDLDRAKAEALKKDAEAAFPEVSFTLAGSSAEAVARAQVITTATTSKKPVFSIKDLQEEKVHINAVGAFKPEMQEIDAEVMQKADKLFVDDFEGALAESGDLIIPLNDGRLRKEDISGEIGEVLLGTKKGREESDRITVYETVGMGSLDVVTAKAIFKKALAGEIGTRLSLH